MSVEPTNVKERRVMIVPIGLEISRVIEGFTPYPINVVYLITSPKEKSKDSQGEKGNITPVHTYTMKFAEKIRSMFENSYLIVDLRYAKLNSFFDCYKVLDTIFNEEIKTGKVKHFYINISTASKAFSLSAYVFALLHYNMITIFYLKASNYIILEYLEKNVSTKELEEEFLKNGLTKKPYIIDEIPTFPIVEISKEEKSLIKILSKERQFDSIKRIIKLYLESKGKVWGDTIKKEKNRLRTKIKRILNELRQKHYIKFKKESNKIRIIVNENLVHFNRIINLDE